MPYDLSQLAEDLSALLGRKDLTQREIQEWIAGSATGGPDNNGTYPLTDSTGFVRMLPSPAKLQQITTSAFPAFVFPDQFDAAAGSGAGHDDAICLQAMFNAQYLSPYPRPTLRPRARYYSSATLLADPSRNTLEGNSAQIGWDLKTFTDPAAQTELVADPEFDTGTPWIAGSDDDMPGGSVVYDGKARATQTSGVQRYYNRGQQITCAAGDSLQVTVNVASITPNTVGVNTFHVVELSLRKPAGSAAASIANGGNAGSSKLTLADNAPGYAPNKTYTWLVTPNTANPYIRISSNASFVIESVSVKVVPNNVCLLVRVPEGSAGGTLRGHNQREWRNFKLSGRAGFGAFVDAVMFDTPTYATGDLGQHSRVNWYNFDISDNVGRGLLFKNRTYLSNFTGFRIVTSVVNIDVLGGDDAGENINFGAGNLGGGPIAVRNLPGYALRFRGTSMDFCPQFLIGGNILLDGCWLENRAAPGDGVFTANAAAGANTLTNVTAGDFVELGTAIGGTGIPAGTTVTGWNAGTKVLTLSANNTLSATATGATYTYVMTTIDRPVIDCTGSTIRLRNTLIQQDGDTSTRLLSPFRVAAGATLDIDVLPGYNLPARGEALCTGAGRFVFTQKASGPNRNTVVINKRDDDHNIVGADGRFEGAAINVAAFLAPTAIQQRPDRYTLTEYGSGTFTADMTRGSRLLYAPSFSPTSTVVGRQITSGQVPAGTTIADYQIAGQTFTGTTTNGSNVITGVSPTPTAAIARGRYMVGPGVPVGARVLTYSPTTITLDMPIAASNAGASFTTPDVLVLSQAVNVATAAGASFAYLSPSTDSAIMRLTSAYTPFEGTQCLEIYKNLPTASALTVHIAVPVEPNRGYGSELRWAVPPDASLSGTGSIFIQPFLRRLIDADGAQPRLGGNAVQITDLPKTNIPMATGTDGWVDRAPFDTQTGLWRTLAIGLNSPGLGLHDGLVPQWATHFVWTISMVSMPRGSRLLIDGLIGNPQ